MDQLYVRHHAWPEVDEIINFLRPYYPDVILAGGAVRDTVLDREIKDYDFFCAEPSDERFKSFLAECEEAHIGVVKATDKIYESSPFEVYNFDWDGKDCQLIFLKQGRTPSEWVKDFPCNLSRIWYVDGTISNYPEFLYYEKYGAVVMYGEKDFQYQDRMEDKFYRDERTMSFYLGEQEFLKWHFVFGEVVHYRKRSNAAERVWCPEWILAIYGPLGYPF